MAAANVVGDKMSMFVIGKAQKPRCKTTETFYLADIDIKKYWMDGVLFEKWVLELDKRFHQKEEVWHW